MMDSISIRIVENGFIISLQGGEDDGEYYVAEFIANDIEEVNYIVTDLLVNTMGSVDMSHVLTDSVACA
jgi:hypothetical protein